MRLSTNYRPKRQTRREGGGGVVRKRPNRNASPAAHSRKIQTRSSQYNIQNVKMPDSGNNNKALQLIIEKYKCLKSKSVVSLQDIFDENTTQSQTAKRLIDKWKRDKKEKVKRVIINRCLTQQPVVLLQKLPHKFKVVSNNNFKAFEKKDPIVLLVDCLKLNGIHPNAPMNSDLQPSSSKTSGKPRQVSQDLKKRGLKDIKLKTKPNKISINVQMITQLLEDAVTLGNAPSRNSRPFDLSNPREECQAITEALSIYSTCVPPQDSIYLFYHGGNLGHLQHYSSSLTLTIQDENSLDALEINFREIPYKNPLHRQALPQQKGKRQPKKKGWLYLSSLSLSDFFFKMKLIPGGREDFERKMLAIMKAGLRVNPNNWTLSEIGYILGFWLAKLYNNQGIPDENLPKELVLAKQHFLELFGQQYDGAIITN